MTRPEPPPEAEPGLRDFEALRAAALARQPERKEFRRSTGEKVAPLHGPHDLPPGHHAAKVGVPGRFPFTRGPHATMYRSRLWTMRQYAGFGTAEDTNRRFRFLLDQGQTGLSVAFDLPTQMGLDSGDARAEGEVGRVGVAIDSVDDMEALLQRIPLDRVSTSMTINATAATLLAMYITVGEAQGVAPAALRGTVQNDILKEYIARGTYIYPPAPSMRLICDLFAFCSEHLPRWNTISISGYHIREAGSDAAQEIAFTLGDGVAYVQAAVARGLEVDGFAPRLTFFFNVHNDFIEEIAKFRAARRLWARVMRDRFGARSPRSQMLRFHTQTAGSTLAAQQPLLNVSRVALQAMAAVLGGTQSLHCNSYDEALGLPTEASALVALRTQQVIAHESGVDAFVDPFAGSYAVETLTDELEARAETYLTKIDEMGGMVAAIEAGYPQREILETAYRSQLAMETGEDVVVGVNRFRVEEENAVEVAAPDPELEAAQRGRVEALKRGRGERAAAAALRALERAAGGDSNLMPAILDCVRGRCTLGEISGVLEERFGRYQETTVV